jgi:cell division protein FtsB
LTAAFADRAQQAWVYARSGLLRAVFVGGVLALVFVALLFVGVFPIRTWVSQNDEIEQTNDKLAILQEENQALIAERDRLETEEEVERLAREQYNLVRPGEEALALLPDAATTTTLPTMPLPSGQERAEQSGFERLIDSLTFWAP